MKRMMLIGCAVVASMTLFADRRAETARIQGEIDAAAAKGGGRVVTEDVVVTNCYLYSACNAIRIGCPSDDTVRNAVFRDLVLEGYNGIASEMPTWYLNPGCKGSFVSADILFERCRIKTDSQPIRLSVSEGVTPTDFGHMTFRDITFESKDPILVWGSAQSPIRDVVFEKVRGKTGFTCPVRSNHVTGLRLDDVSVAGDSSSQLKF